MQVKCQRCGRKTEVGVQYCGSCLHIIRTENVWAYYEELADRDERRDEECDRRYSR